MFALQLRDGSIALPAGRALTTRAQAIAAARYYSQKTAQSLLVVVHPGVLSAGQTFGTCRECQSAFTHEGGCYCV